MITTTVPQIEFVVTAEVVTIAVDSDIARAVMALLDKYPHLYPNWNLEKVVREALLDWLGVPKHDAGWMAEREEHNREATCG